MPLTTFFQNLPFLSAPRRPAPQGHSVASNGPPTVPKEQQPELRICFPLRIQRGNSSWWEYEEFRIQFRDRLMWRQAFRLDEDSRETDLGNPFDDRHEVCLDESSNRGRSNALHDDNNPAPISRFSSSTLPSEASSFQKLKQLMTGRWVKSLTSKSSEKSVSTREVSASQSSSSKYSFEQNQSLHPLPLDLPLRQVPSSSGSSSKERVGLDEVQHHRDITLGALEGQCRVKQDFMRFSTFRKRFHVEKPSTTETQPPKIPPKSPSRPRGSPQDDGTTQLSLDEWIILRDEILGGLTGDAEGLFPFYTEAQQATVLPVEQKEDCFRVQVLPRSERVLSGGMKAALRQVEVREWKDVIFVSYDDTPKEMRWWYTTREPQVLRWGLNML